MPLRERVPAAVVLAVCALATLAPFACRGAPGDATPQADGDSAAAGAGSIAFVGATLVDGTGAPPVPDATLVVDGGRIVTVGPTAEIEVPAGATTVDVAGRWLVPGLVNAHGHVGDTLGLESGHYSRDNVERQLGLYARYGVTTVNSMGGDGPEAAALRDSEDAGLDRARIRLAGAVVAGETPAEAVAVVDANAALGVDYIKIRVDDNLGTTRKMSAEVYTAIIERAHELGLPVEAHLFYLEDAKGLLRAGVDLIAHSVRDTAIDAELIGLLRDSGVCYCPTLAREVSTFVYESRPEFFDDPFFLAEADPEVVAALESPERQQRVRDSAAAQSYKAALDIAQTNLAELAAAGVPIAFGTDTGPPGRFQGYFEHMELRLMRNAGLGPEAILRAATGDAAACLNLDEVGTLELGKWADMIVVTADPLADVRNIAAIESVWVAGNRVPRR